MKTRFTTVDIKAVVAEINAKWVFVEFRVEPVSMCKCQQMLSNVPTLLFLTATWA